MCIRDRIGLSVANARLYLELQASERKFRGLVENAKDVIYLTDPDGRLVYANPAMKRSLGFAPDVLCASGANLLSYLLFERSYCRALIQLGYNDTMSRKDDLVAFLGWT